MTRFTGVTRFMGAVACNFVGIHMLELGPAFGMPKWLWVAVCFVWFWNAYQIIILQVREPDE